MVIDFIRQAATKAVKLERQENDRMVSKNRVRGKQSTWVQDFLASIVVFLVALPLCLGIAIASGAPPMLGLVTGIIGGIVVGSVSGAPLQVSGPAAGLVALVSEILVEFGVPGLGMILLLAGVIQLLCGVFHLGQWFRAISPAVIQGMLAGIGVLIMASQFHVMVDDKPRKTGLDNLLSIPEALWKGIGIPHLAPPAERAYRTTAMKAMADLAHEQVLLRTHVGERVPFHEAVDETPELKSIIVDDLAELAERQQGISDKLGELDEQLDQVIVDLAGKKFSLGAKGQLDAIRRVGGQLDPRVLSPIADREQLGGSAGADGQQPLVGAEGHPGVAIIGRGGEPPRGCLRVPFCH